MTLDTFSAVETHYNNTKPVVSKYHTKEDDIRPLGRRDRKHERIEKRSDTEYVFHDHWLHAGLPSDKKTIYEERPPITWQKLIRKGEETEVVTVRGATSSTDTTRHNFLRQYLPWGLMWDVRPNGRHLVIVTSSIDGFADVPFVLRTGRRATSHHMPHPKEAKGSYIFKTAHNRHVAVQKFVETDYLLRFTRTDGVGVAWQCTTPEWPITRSHVNKDRKAALREHNDKFWEWVCSVGSMLHTNWDHLQNLEQEVKEYVKENNATGELTYPMSYNFWPRFPQTLALEIVKDYNHPLRIHLATSFLAHNDIKSLISKEDNSRFRSAYNQWFNKQLGIMEEVIK